MTRILIKIGMNDCLPILMEAGTLALLEITSSKQTDMLLLAAALTQKTGATLIDGGNHFNAYVVTGRVRHETHDLSAVDSLLVARAFNCYQVVELLKEVPQNGCPCLVIDLLATFFDDSLSFQHRSMLLSQVLAQFRRIQKNQAVVVSLSPPKEEIEQWHQLTTIIRRQATTALEENFMGKTIPTINQVIQQAEIILARFSRVIQPEERAAMDDLFISAKKHIAAISEANHLLPFEVVQQAMLLEQQKEILQLKKRLVDLEKKLVG